MTITMPQCAFCRHLNRSDRTRNTCTAFPDGDGIPIDIFRNDADHRKPYPGDHGIRFDPVDDDAARIVASIFDENAA